MLLSPLGLDESTLRNCLLRNGKLQEVCNNQNDNNLLAIITLFSAEILNLWGLRGMNTSYSSNENIIKRTIEAWSNDKLEQYYVGCQDAANFKPELYNISQDMVNAAFILVKAELARRGFLC